MARPDYILYGALVVGGYLTIEEAQALCEAHDSVDYDRPVPASLDAGLDIAINVLSEVEDDEAIDAMLNHRSDDGDSVDCQHCEVCGEPITEDNEDDGTLSDLEVGNALDLYFAVRSIIAEVFV